MKQFRAVRYATVRLILEIDKYKYLATLQLDIYSAFVNGSWGEIIFIDQPEGSVDPSRSTWVYRLLKSLFRLEKTQTDFSFFEWLQDVTRR